MNRQINFIEKLKLNHSGKKDNTNKILQSLFVNKWKELQDERIKIDIEHGGKMKMT